MSVHRLLVVTLLSLPLLGCVAPAKYAWGNYDGSLYGYYKDSTRMEAHVEEIENIIKSAEKSNKKVAPGIHAEYGYFLMQNGKLSEAAVQFEKEKTDWPESTQLMSNMIKIAVSQSSKPVASKE
jgi:hypothetical protein